MLNPGIRLRTYLAATALAALFSLAGPAQASQNPAPTALDVMALFMQGGTGVDPQQIFEKGVLANMRIPPEYLRVAFMDTRTGRPISRDEIRHLLGQSRQDGAHQLLEMAASHFTLPGGLDPDHLIDLFDAAALASMRRPPQHVSIEFYDQRTGPEGSQRGGISGQTPDYVFTPQEGLQQPQKKQKEEAPLSRSEVLKEWPSEKVAQHFVDQGYRFTGQDNQVASTFHGFAVSKTDFLDQVEAELKELEEFGTQQFGEPIKVKDMRVEHLEELTFPGHSEKLYLSIVVITASDRLIRFGRMLFPELN